MMTYADVLTLLATASDDLSVYESFDGHCIHVTIEDFDGFDEHWCEIDRDYDEDLVGRILDTLTASASEVDRDYYTDYYFDGFTVRVGYASYDI